MSIIMSFLSDGFTQGNLYSPFLTLKFWHYTNLCTHIANNAIYTPYHNFKTPFTHSKLDIVSHLITFILNPDNIIGSKFYAHFFSWESVAAQNLHFRADFVSCECVA